MAGPKSIKELIEQAKARPGTMNMGAGTITSRLGAVLFAKTAGIDVQLIPFKGSAEIGQAVLSGTVDFALNSTGTALPLVQGGQYRALAKYTNQPLPMFPGRAEPERSRRPARDRRELDLDRGRGARGHAAADRRQDPEGDREDLCRQADHGRSSRRSASMPVSSTPGRAHGVHPQRERALVAGSQGQQSPLEAGTITHNNAHPQESPWIPAPMSRAIRPRTI